MDVTRRIARAVVLSLVAAVLTVVVLPTAAAARPASAQPGTLQLQTVPPLPGVVVKVDGKVATSDAKGRIRVHVRNFINLDKRVVVPETRISRDRKVVFDRFRGDVDAGVRKVVELGLRTARLVSWSFLDRFGKTVPADRVTAMRLRSNTGEIHDLSGAELARPRWVSESRTQQGPQGLASKQLYYVVDSAMVDGTSVVNRAGQRFVPWEQQAWVVQLLFFRVSFTATDMFFTRQVGDGIELTRADGDVQRLPFGRDGTALVPDLPRGTYTITVLGGGVSFGRPVSISKDQEVTLTVISAADLTLVAVAVLVVAVGLVLLGRPHLLGRLRRAGRALMARTPRARRRPRPQHRRRLRTRPAATRQQHVQAANDRRPASARGGVTLVVLLLAALAVTLAPTGTAHAEVDHRRDIPHPSVAPVPVLAYYYIWFNPTSWNRAKIDYPLLGRYSSDDTEIMRRHVRMAKTAGINGFLVSWKHTPQLDERLAKLVEVAREEKFRLGIVYQGLDFSRTPLAFDTVRTDLSFFATRYTTDPVFDIFGRPLVVWTGSDRFTAAQIKETIGGVRGKLLVLGNAKSLEDVESSQGALDGQAYYWSSVDPVTGTTGRKLAEMSQAVHQRGGLWIAPVTPGFDARLVGGKREVPRRKGDTLRASFAAARLSQPDAIGVISWNEFSENTHIEPSERFGAADINVLADLLGVGVDVDVPVDSSEPGDGGHWGLSAWSALVVAGAAAVLLPLGVAFYRRRSTPAGTPSDRPTGTGREDLFADL
jgi:hypothetical protein